jgi:hypothetical protein
MFGIKRQLLELHVYNTFLPTHLALNPIYGKKRDRVTGEFLVFFFFILRLETPQI